jgi:hypothetical protein
MKALRRIRHATCQLALYDSNFSSIETGLLLSRLTLWKFDCLAYSDPNDNSGKVSDVAILGKIIRVSAFVAIILVYFTVLWLGLTEEGRRSLTIVNETSSSGDFVTINVRVTSIDTAQGLIHERIRLIPMGRFAIDKTTPATDLKILLNSVSGRQTVVFPKGERIGTFEATTLLTGNPNRYPFDSYTTGIDLLVTAPSKQKTASAPQDNLKVNPNQEEAASLVVGTTDLNQSETIPIKENFTASLVGIKFSGSVTEDHTLKLTRTTVEMRRANSVITVSLIVMVIMFVLAFSIVGMVMHVAAFPGEINLLPLSLCVALIFGLPALRSIQPSVPAVGVLSDYLSFIWAEFMVASSAIALAWIWIIRARGDKRFAEPPPE